MKKTLKDSILSDGVKLKIYGPKFWPRNKIPHFPRPDEEITVPDEFSASLDETLYQNFVKDLQATIQYAKDTASLEHEFWFTLCMYILIDAMTEVEILPFDEGESFLLLVGLVIVSHMWYNSFREALENEIQLRITEWQPYFRRHGVSLEYVVDKPSLFKFTETYLLIQKVATRKFVLPPEKQEANYLVFFARSFVRRNHTMRVVDVHGRYLRKQLIVPKAPTLKNLDTAVFETIMNEAKSMCTLYNQLAKFFIVASFIGTMVLGVLLFDKNILAVAITVAIFIMTLFYNILPALGMYSLSNYKLKKWDNQLKEHGFTISYHVDKRTLFRPIETYLKIRVLDEALEEGRNTGIRRVVRSLSRSRSSSRSRNSRSSSRSRSRSFSRKKSMSSSPENGVKC